MPKLVGPGVPQEIEITRAGVVVGRDHGCDVVVRSQNVSRRHARVFRDDSTLFVEDLRSHNGSTLNGAPLVGTCEVAPGDQIVFGDASFVIVDEPVSAPTRTPVAAPVHAPINVAVQPAHPAALVVRRPAPEPVPPEQTAALAIPRPQPSGPFFRILLYGIVLLLAGLGLGRGARALGQIELADDPLSSQMVPDDDEPEEEEPTVAAGVPVSGSPEPASGAQPAVKPIEHPVAPPVESAIEGDTALADSAKTFRLMREVQRSGIDLQDVEGIRRIALEKLKLTPAETDRVMKTFAALAQRNALLQGKKLPDNINGTPVVQKPVVQKPAATKAPVVESASAPEAEAPARKVRAVPFVPRPRGSGYYVNLWGLALVFCVLLLWRWGVDWIDRDSRSRGLRPQRLLQIASIAGPVGAMLALCFADLGVGLILETYCCSGPLLAYLVLRDSRAPRQSRLQPAAPVAEEPANLADVGMNRNLQGSVRDLLDLPQGLFIVCGPTRSGKVTTLRSALAELESAGRNVVTPGEIHDAAAAADACNAANGGQLVLALLDAPDAVSAVQRLCELNADRLSLAGALNGVLAQRLMRRLCSDCKTAYQPDMELIRRYRIPLDHEARFYRPPATCDEPCLSCGGTGYRGRVGVFELLTFDDHLRTLVRDQAAPGEIRSAARRLGMTTLRENGLRLVIRGVTSLEEFGQVILQESQP